MGKHRAAPSALTTARESLASHDKFWYPGSGWREAAYSSHGHCESTYWANGVGQCQLIAGHSVEHFAKGLFGILTCIEMVVVT